MAGGPLLQTQTLRAIRFFKCVQLVLRSGVLTILDLDEVDVTLSFAEVFRSVLSGVHGR